MSFVGIITNQKNEAYMKMKISEYVPIDNILFINDKNIGNIKNIRFEIILIDRNIKSIEILKKMIKNVKCIVLNADLSFNLSILENLNLVVITYGFNSKATFTVSSIDENKIMICLQRIIKNSYGKLYEPQEIEVRKQENIENMAIIATKVINIILEKK